MRIVREFNIIKKIETKEDKVFNFVNEIDYNYKKINVAEYRTSEKQK